MTKRVKVCDSYDDTLSQLHDDILINILSLVPLKEAGRTSILSSRWINIWKHIPYLNFEDRQALETIQNYYGLRDMKRCNYVQWVEKVLGLSEAPVLKAFIVHFELDITYKKHIKRWLHYAFSHHIERLELSFLTADGKVLSNRCTFPSRLLYQNRTNPFQSSYDFKSLKILSLKSVNVSGDDLSFFLDNGPNLEQLVVWYSSILYDLEISGFSKKLKVLELWYCVNLVSLKVFNSNLVSLSLKKSVESASKLLLDNDPSLVNVAVVFGEHHMSIYEIPSMLSSCLLQLESLQLFIDDPENMTELLDLPKFPKLKKLALCFYYNNVKHLIGVTPLIIAARCLEEFVLELDWGGWFKLPAMANKLKKAQRYHPLKFLRVVKIYGFPSQTRDFEFIVFFLQNAIRLERIIIEQNGKYIFDRDHPLTYPDKAERHKLFISNLVEQCKRELPQHVELVLL